MGGSRSVVRLVGAALLQGAQCLRDGSPVVRWRRGARLSGVCRRQLPWANRREGLARLPLNVVDQPTSVVDLDIDQGLIHKRMTRGAARRGAALYGTGSAGAAVRAAVDTRWDASWRAGAAAGASAPPWDVGDRRCDGRLFWTEL
jgi:hypothetical protein